MENENRDGSEVLETTENEAEEATETHEETQEQQETVDNLEELKAKAAKADELEKKNKQLFERLKKAPKPTANTLSETDLFALMKADVAQDDLEEVKTYAAYKKIPVSQALQDKTLKAILAERAEERRTALAAQTKSGRGTAQVSDATILERAARGELPDESDVEKLAAARMAAIKNSKSR